MARKEMKATRKRSPGRRRKKDPITRTNTQDTMKKKVATKSHLTMRKSRMENTTSLERRRRKANTVTRSSTRRDRRPPVTTRRPTRMSTTKNTNSTMTSTRKANTR